jgi:hypothetical protein
VTVVARVPVAVACRNATWAATGSAVAWLLVTEVAAGPSLTAPLPAALRALGLALVAFTTAALALRRTGGPSGPVERGAFRLGALAGAVVGLPLAILSVFRLSVCASCATVPDVSGGLWAGALAGTGLWMATWLAGRLATPAPERWRPRAAQA